MSEVGPSISEIRKADHAHRISRDSNNQFQSSGNEPQKPRTLGERLKSIVLKLAQEKEFKPEDYSVQVVSEDILNRMGNRIRGGINQEANMPVQFDIRDLLSNKGQVRAMDNPNSPAYQAANQTLNSLVREGALEIEELPEEFHGTFRRYHVVNPDKLRELSLPDNNE